MYSQVASNKRKTVLLMVIFVLLIASIGWIYSQVQGSYGFFVGIFIFAIVYSLVGYYASAKIALAISGAKLVGKSDAPAYYRIVENLSITAGLPMPKLYIINDPAPNAFATGRDPNNAAVAATTGLLSMLDEQEIEGVMAHELSHVGNYDIRVMGIVLVLVTVIAMLSDIFIRMMWFGGNRRNNREGGGALVLVGIVAAILAPLVATLLKLAVSRKREYLADASGSLLTRYPDGLASALKKIGEYNIPMKHGSTATAHLFFANPLKNKAGHKSGIASLFSTHPPIEDRIKKLSEMGGSL